MMTVPNKAGNKRYEGLRISKNVLMPRPFLLFPRSKPCPCRCGRFYPRRAGPFPDHGWKRRSPTKPEIKDTKGSGFPKTCSCLDLFCFFLDPNLALVDADDSIRDALDHFQIMAGKDDRQVVLAGELHQQRRD